MNKQAETKIGAAAPNRRRARSEPDKPPEGASPELESPWPGLPWNNPWLELWAGFWTTWLGPGFQVWPTGERQPPGSERRQEDGLPWMPKLETTVIPLRRRTDPPGQHAEKISLRMQLPNLPWLGDSKVIAIDTVVQRAREPRAETSGMESAPNNGWR